MAHAGAPDPHLAVPQEMIDIAGGPVTLVWRNEVGGLTGRVDGEPGAFVKWNPRGSGESLGAEAERLRWLRGRHPAPIVVDLVIGETAEMLLTAALPGDSAIDAPWADRPDDALRAIAVGLRDLHALPIASCPFDWGVATRIRAANEAGRAVPATLRTAPPIDRLVVCHGDACAPNTLIARDGRFCATVDVGRLGVADRWADLAVATLSLEWNYERFDERLFWNAYGVEPDADRISYYRALWDAT